MGRLMSSSYGGGLRRGYERARAVSPTYPEVGASVDGPLPSGYDHVEARAQVGAAGDFERAREALFGWAPQRYAGIAVHPPDAVPTLGATVLLRIRLGPLRITAPCRVSWTADDADRAGFAYGTLPGHPERGEEAFILRRTSEGTVLTIRAFSRPDRWYSRLGAPVSRLVQRHVTAAYLRAIPSAIQPSANS
jgi:uncharacterized protein (UPF0548 family)